MPEERRVSVAERPKHDGPHPDRVIQRIAATQHGVLGRHQLIEAGISDGMLKARLASGHLLRLHRGVYAVGHARLRREGWWLAAILACRPRAALSHRDAAALHGIRPSSRATVDVTVVGSRPRRAGITLHRTSVLEPSDLINVDGIPTTSVARTLVDLASIVAVDSVAKAIGEAERLRLLDVVAVDRVLWRTRGRRGPGHTRIAQALAEHRALGTSLTRSPLEDRFLARTNVLMLAGYRVLRYTHDDLVRRPATVLSGIRAALARPPAAPSAVRATMSGACR